MVGTAPRPRSWQCVSSTWTADGAGWGYLRSAVDTTAVAGVVPANPPVVHRVVHTLCMGRGARNQNVTKWCRGSDSTRRFRVAVLKNVPEEVNHRRTGSRGHQHCVTTLHYSAATEAA